VSYYQNVQQLRLVTERFIIMTCYQVCWLLCPEYTKSRKHPISPETHFESQMQRSNSKFQSQARPGYCNRSVYFEIQNQSRFKLRNSNQRRCKLRNPKSTQVQIHKSKTNPSENFELQNQSKWKFRNLMQCKCKF
jgi:hypothetical protein